MEKTIEQLKPVFAQVAEKIGQGAEFGYEVVYRQQIAEGIVNLALMPIFIAIFMFGIKIFKKGLRDHEVEYGEGLVFMTLGSVISLLSFIVFICTLVEGILYLVNPHYYAIQFFLDLVK